MNYDKLFKFTMFKSGYALTRYLGRGDNIGEVEIPSVYNGVPVTAIGDEAFYRATAVERVHIPESVTEIGMGAFSNMFTLEEINIPDGVVKIGDDAFRYCLLLKNVKLPEGLKRIGKYAFTMCVRNLTEVVLPKSLERLGSSAFAECESLTSVTFRNPRTELGETVFKYCPKLRAENVLMGILRSVDLTAPIPPYVYGNIPEDILKYGYSDYTETILRGDVFALAVKNGCFRSVRGGELTGLFGLALKLGLTDILYAAEEGGLLSDRAMLEELIDCSAERGKTEITAWLLDCKNRKFGFNGGNDLEL